MTKAPAKHTRRINALLKKTTFNGCTPGEAASALSLASTIVSKHGLNSADFTWPEPPAGWRWEGVRGHGGSVVENPKRERKPKASAEPKPPRVTNGERLAKLAEKPEGFTIDDITTMLGILPHTARALISVELRKKRGLNVVISEGRYQVAPAA